MPTEDRLLPSSATPSKGRTQSLTVAQKDPRAFQATAVRDLRAVPAPTVREPRALSVPTVKDPRVVPDLICCAIKPSVHTIQAHVVLKHKQMAGRNKRKGDIH
mmetsp:Transcript_23321/g.42293  ORF Transcript_23321/g.42293 Transcript_23321/m.42293 type:complete len:103 (+) Transcript_23321:124-432(+)